MNAVQAAYTAASILAIAAVLAGLKARRLLRASYFWVLYLLAVLVGEGLILGWPQRFYTWSFWQLKETLYALLKLATAVELGLLTLGSFPGGRRRAQQWTLGILVLALLAVSLPVQPGPVWSIALELIPRLSNATALLFAAVWLLVLYYHVPLHRIHRAILRGLAAYLVLFTFAARVVGALGGQGLAFGRYLDSTAYVAMCLYWAWEAWRRVKEPSYPVELTPYLAWRARFPETLE